MAKQLDEKTQGIVDKAVTGAKKEAVKDAGAKVKAEIDRINASDLSKPEKKAAIAALKNVQTALKS